MGELEEHAQMEIKELDRLAQLVGISKNALKNSKAELKKEGKIHISAKDLERIKCIQFLKENK